MAHQSREKQDATNAEIQAVVYRAPNTAYKGSQYTQATHGNTTHSQRKHQGYGAPSWKAALNPSEWNVNRQPTFQGAPSAKKKK